jgi:glycosyltransferase involved in cell wall biosynthesis
MTIAGAAPQRAMLVYLGRRGSMPRFTFEAMRAASALPGVEATVLVSRQNESFGSFAEFGGDLVAVDTFSSNGGALLDAWRIPLLRRRIAREIRRRRIGVVIELMPHVWSRWLIPTIRAAGARYFVIAHDAQAHPGDVTSLAKGMLDVAVRRADRVITLSEEVAVRLRAEGRVAPERISSLFHPDISYGPPAPRPPRRRDEALRLLFLGRIMSYKGLPLFVGALEALRRVGHLVEAGVFGEGPLGAEASRLDGLGAEVVNRWLSEDEIASILPRYHVMVVSHVESSQSGVVATAFGAGLPVVATPVGGLPEQVDEGVTGLIAAAASADALAAAIARLVVDHDLYVDLCEGVTARSAGRSMKRFVSACLDLDRP